MDAMTPAELAAATWKPVCDLPTRVQHYCELPPACSCGLRWTEAQWLELPLVGYQIDPEECLEMRNCSCGSTRSRLCRLVGAP